MRGTRFAAFRWGSVAAALYRAEGRRAILWLPVAQGIGVILYFSLDVEPDPIWASVPILPALALMFGVGRAGWGAALGLWLALMGSIGFALALASAHFAAAPVIDYPVGRTVEGRIV